ncbi:hypothetical protein VIC_002316 [Vibrio coralliilyticus ATCC BAA-450]|nr:hypothetical protein VIC_002316 [Vibrio coralliilyticus ATCC BAA-450]
MSGSFGEGESWLAWETGGVFSDASGDEITDSSCTVASTG